MFDCEICSLTNRKFRIFLFSDLDDSEQTSDNKPYSSVGFNYSNDNTTSNNNSSPNAQDSPNEKSIEKLFVPDNSLQLPLGMFAVSKNKTQMNIKR